MQNYASELLWGDEFLSRFAPQLDTLKNDREFLALIESIRASACGPSGGDAVVEKEAARRMMFESGARFDYPALSEIVDAVAADGYAKNSALISTYFAMRILSGEPTTNTVPATPNQNETPNSELDFRLKWKTEYRCEDGHYVRSKNEALVDNWLYSHGICHAYEKALFSAESNITYCSDFYLPAQKLYIEVWGLIDDAYERKRAAKTHFYESQGFQLLSIDGNQIKCLDDILSRNIRA